ncbi:MAG: T9SS type A sorting domain-containing protein, partial [Candidatus Eisenbacteria bacterium]
GDQLADDVRYGPGGLAVPAPGAAWARREQGWVLEPTPSPQGLQGSGSASVACGAVCEPQRFRIDGSGERLSRELVLQQGAFQTDTRYDLRKRLFSVSSGGLTAGLDLRDSYRIETPDGLPFAVPMRFLIQARDRDSCFRGVCRRSVRRLLLFVDGALVDSLRRPLTDTSTIALRVLFTPGVSRELRIVAEAQGVTFGGLEAAVSGEWVIPELPEGVRLRSCNGVDSDDERVVREVRSATVARRAELEWVVQAGPDFRAWVERLDESEAGAGWRPLEERSPDANGILRFIDDRVLREHTYRYRLFWSDRFGGRLGGETRVEVSRSFGFALLGVQPNPSVGSARVAFELPEAGLAQLEVFDLAGRRVRDTRLRLEAGPQSLALDAGRRLPPGVYRVRLRSEGREARSTAVVIP